MIRCVRYGDVTGTCREEEGRALTGRGAVPAQLLVLREQQRVDLGADRSDDGRLVLPSATESTPSIRASSPASAYGEYAAMAPVSPKAAEIWAAAVLLRWDSPLNGGTSRAKSAATRSGEPAACRSPSSAVNRSNSSSTVGSPR